MKSSKKKAQPRKEIKFAIQVAVLTEAGYRCAVPTCRQILALDLHHMAQVAEGGKDTADNLLPLCPSCHALYHRGVINKQSIYAWKSLLVSLTRAFDVATLDQLLFLKKPESQSLRVSGDGVLEFTRLIGAGFASFSLELQNGPLLLYSIKLTTAGDQLVTAWTSGDRDTARKLLSASVASP